jgi:hypothetical protein
MIDSPDEQHRAERHPSPTATIIEVPLWYPTHRLSTPHLRYSLFVIDKPCPLRYPSFVIHHDHTYSLRTERMRILSRKLANNFSTNGQRPAANVSVVPRPREKRNYRIERNFASREMLRYERRYSTVSSAVYVFWRFVFGVKALTRG